MSQTQKKKKGERVFGCFAQKWLECDLTWKPHQWWRFLVFPMCHDIEATVSPDIF